MTELDLEIPGLAAEVINDFGKSIVYQRTPTDGSGYDPATGTIALVGEPVNIKGIVEPYRGQRLMAGLVEASDLKITIAADGLPDGFLPTPEDIASFDGEDYKVKNVMPTYSGELVAIYELQVGR